MSPTAERRAMLISGPPGIGKTTAASLIGKELKYTVLAFNASDTRDKTSVDRVLKSVSVNSMISAKVTPQIAIERSMVIMDEMDGLSAGDRGGAQALISYIKTAAVPIVCICNDRQCRVVRSISKHCTELRFTRPTVMEVAARVLSVAQLEGIAIEEAEALDMATGAGSDIRQCLMQLQSDSSGPSEKDSIVLDPFEATRKLLGGGRISLDDRSDLYFLDHEMMPMMVHENYLGCCDSMAQAKAAASSVALGDICSTKLRRHQKWGLMPTAAHLAVANPTMAVSPYLELEWPRFPIVLAKSQTLKKSQRLLKELHGRLSGKVRARPNAVMEDYADLIYRRVCEPLIANGSSGRQEAYKRLHEFRLRKEHMEHLQDLRFPSQQDLFGNLDPKLKLQFTLFCKAEEKAPTIRRVAKGEKKSTTTEELDVKKEVSDSDSEGE